MKPVYWCAAALLLGACADLTPTESALKPSAARENVGSEDDPWIRIEGSGVEIGIGAGGDVFVLGNDDVQGGRRIYKQTSSGWQLFPGGAVRIDVDPAGNPWIVSSAKRIYRWTGQQFVQVPGEATDIGIGADGSVFIVGDSEVAGGYRIYKWTGSAWQLYPGGAVGIDVDPNGHPWIVSSGMNVYRWNGQQFVQLPGKGVDVGVGADGTAYVLGEEDIDSNLFCIASYDPQTGLTTCSWEWAEGAGHEIYKWTGTSWLKLSGLADRISADQFGRPWITSRSEKIYRGN